MGLNKKMKKLAACICAMTMVIAGMTGYQAKVNGAIPDDMTVIDNTQGLHTPDGTAWQVYFGGAGGPVASGAFKGGTSLSDAFSLYVEQTSGVEWGIQAATPQIGGIVAAVQYQYSITFTASKAGSFYTKENISNSKKTLQEYTAGENTVKGVFTAASTNAIILIDMVEVESDTLFEFTDISVTDDFEEVTTETPTADAEGYDYTISEEWTSTTPWQAFAGGKNSMRYKAGTIDKTNLGLDLEVLSNSGADWSLQARILGEKTVFGPLVKGDVYDVEFAYTSNMDGSIVFQIDGNHNDVMEIEAGTHTITFKYTALNTNYPNIYMNLAGLPAGTIFNFNAKFTTETGTPEVTTTSEQDTPEVTTASEQDTPEVTTASEPDTPEATTASEPDTPEATTTSKPDTPEVTTVAPTTPAKAQIKKVTAKKKAAKKVKLSLKKIKGASGYQIAVYKTKKNAKSNKKAIIKKIVKKTKVIITSKKLKNKNKLFVKARAYALDANGKKLYGKWSKVKPIKIK